MSGQTSYSEYQPIGVAGMPVDNGHNHRIAGRYTASEAMGFGLAVAKLAEGTVRLCAAAGDVTSGLFCGFTRQSQDEASGSGYLINRPVSIMTEGEIWVETTETTAVGGAVYVVYAAGASRGKVAAAASGSTALLPNATFQSVATVGNLVRVKFSTPG